MKVTETRPGIPCWFELSSTDPNKSFGFYHELFGWTKNDMQMSMGTYSFLRNANGTVGAMWPMPSNQQAQGIPSYWGVYFLVDDCEKATAKAAELGATVCVPTMDVDGHGRMSVLADPTGAMLCLWQAAPQATGDFVMFEDHSVGWVELATRDSGKARSFYSALFNWSYVESPIPIPDSGNYTEISVHGTRYGGILPMNAQWGEIPPHWAIYILVSDVDACVKRASELGGKMTVPPFDAPGVGRIAMISDPTGAHTYVIRLNSSSS
jgi:uncharacterized protein